MKSFDRFKQENIIYKLITLAVLAAAVFFVCKIGYGAIRSLSYSRELLEPSNIALTNEFLEGKSPYSLDSLTWDVPAINYDYPFINSLLAAGIAKITGCTAITAHLFISFISIILSGLIGFMMVRDKMETTVAPFLTGLMFMLCHWRFGYVSAAPDNLGLLLFMATLYVAVCPKIKNKPIWSAIGITLCFYTKQYFMFVAASIFIYMLLYSWKEAIKLFVWTVGINIGVALLITRYWPLYWMRTIAFTFLGTVVGGGREISNLIDQVGYLAFPFAALFAIIITAAFMGLRKLKKRDNVNKRIHICANDPFILSVINAVIMLAPLFVLGRNDGAFLSYFLQLWIHSVAVVAVICIERMKPAKHELIFQCIYCAVAAFTVYFGFGKLPVHILTDEEIAQWNKAYVYISDFSDKGDVFCSRSLAYEGMRTDNADMLCGHDGEVHMYTVNNMETNGIPMEYFPYTQKLVDQNLEYRDGILRKAQDHEYALITFEPGTDAKLFDEEICEGYGYKCIDSLELQVGNMPYEVLFYAIN